MPRLTHAIYLNAILSLVSPCGNNALAQAMMISANCPKGCNCGETLNCFTAAMDMKTGKIVVKKDVDVKNLGAVIRDLRKIQSATVNMR